jgi:uncharacterized protein (DUF1810 family)
MPARHGKDLTDWPGRDSVILQVMSDPFGLQRFVAAQDGGGTYARALDELRAGSKTSHWMCYDFPQTAGLGRSPTAQHYAISSLAEAEAYLAHPVLGPRLRESTAALLEHADASAEDVLGATDAMKLRSSMTLFARAVPEEPVYAEVLERFVGGEADPATLQGL